MRSEQVNRLGFGAREERVTTEEKGFNRHISDGAGRRGPRARLRVQRLQGRGVRGPDPERAQPLGCECLPTFTHNQCYI